MKLVYMIFSLVFRSLALLFLSCALVHPLQLDKVETNKKSNCINISLFYLLEYRMRLLIHSDLYVHFVKRRNKFLLLRTDFLLIARNFFSRNIIAFKRMPKIAKPTEHICMHGCMLDCHAQAEGIIALHSVCT